MDHVKVFTGFIVSINGLIEFFRVQRPIKQDDPNQPTRAQAERIAKFVEPVAKDGGAQFNINIQGDVHIHADDQLTLDSERANAVQNNIRRFLGRQVPETGYFEREVLYLEQMRKGSSVGDRGVIEKFSSRAVKLHFMSDEVKDAIIGKRENPFQLSYVIDGVVSTARGEPALYKITNVHEAIGPAPALNTRRRRKLILPKKRKRGRRAA